MNRLAAAAIFCLATAGSAFANDCDLAEPTCIVFIPLGDLPGGQVRSEAAGLSRDGTVVVGTSDAALGSEAFRWKAGTLTGLSSLEDGVAQSRATGVRITQDDEWISGAISSGGNVLRAGLYSVSDATWTHLDTISDSGQSYLYGLAALTDLAVGSSSSSQSGTNPQQAAIHDALGWTGLDPLPGGSYVGEAYAVDEWGQVVVGAASSGAASGTDGREAFRWTLAAGMQGLGFLSGAANSSRARAIDARGVAIVGGASSENSGTGATEAFLWMDDEMIGLGDLEGGSFDSEALAVSVGGQIVVGRGRSEFGDRAFLWNADEPGMRELRDVFEEISGTSLDAWKLEEATAISRSGRVIAGNGRNPEDLPEAWVLSLPEPGPTLSGLLALLGLRHLGRRRLAKTTPA